MRDDDGDSAEARAHHAIRQVHEWARIYLDKFDWVLAPVWGTDVDTGECFCGGGEICPAPGKHLVEGVPYAHKSGEELTVWPLDGAGLGKVEKWGIAALCGSVSKLLVLDLEEGEELPIGWADSRRSPVLVQNTPSKGRHMFFKLNDDESVGSTGGRRLDTGGKPIAEGGFVILYPRVGYSWEGGAAVFQRTDLSTIPNSLRMSLGRAGVLVATGTVHQDETWSTPPGIPPVGPTLRSPTILGDVRRFVDHWGHLVRKTPGRGWSVWTEDGWMFGERAETEITTMAHRLGDIVRADARRAHDNGNADEGNRLLAWSNTIARRRARALLVELENDARIQLRGHADWDHEGHVAGLPSAGGGSGLLLDLHHGTISSGARQRLVSRKLGATFNGLGEWAHVWDRGVNVRRYLDGLRAVHGDEFMRLLQRAAGASLFGAGGAQQDEDAVFVLGGQPRSGKSTFIETLLTVAGDYGKALGENVLFGDRGNPDFANASLLGIRVAAISEPPSSGGSDRSALNVTKLKALSGGDTLTGRAPYGRQEITYRPEASIWIATNHPLEHSDEALWERLKIFTFRSDFSGGAADPKIRQQMTSDPHERAAFLAWAVQGSVDFHREGWGDTSMWRSTITEQKSVIDPFSQFITETITVTANPADQVDMNQVWSAFHSWAMITDGIGADLSKMTRSRAIQEIQYRLKPPHVAFDVHTHIFSGCVLNARRM